MGWSAARAMRERREALGMAQSDLAGKLGVTKALLSLYESGKRLPTEEHLPKLAEALGIPTDLLRIGSGKLPTDVLQALDTDAAGVVAAVRQQTEARASSYPTAPQRIPTPTTSATPSKGERLPEWAAPVPPDTLDGNMCSGGSDGNEKEVHGRVQA